MAIALNYSPPSSLIKVVFPNRSFSKVFATTAVTKLSGAQATSLGVMADLLSDLKVTRETPPPFDSIKEMAGIEYVGYIIDKERLNRSTGDWHRTDEYRLIGADSNSFKDTRVAYGEIYRYRMKSVIRITTRSVTTETTTNNSFQSIYALITQRLNEEIQKNKELFFNTNNFVNKGLRGKNKPKIIEIKLFGDFIARFSTDKVEVVQAGTPLAVNGRSLQNSKITHINVLGKSFNVYLPIKNTTITTQKEAFKSHYYESVPSKEWTYVDIFEDVPPPPPEAIKISPNTLSNQIIITWLRPSNSQRDIKAYRVYRRSETGEAWALLTEVDEIDINSDGIPDAPVAMANSSNLFIDKTVNVGMKYIYALSCVDIHGIESFLSTQIQAQLNSNFALEREEKPLKWISGSGAKKTEISFVYKKFFNRTETLVAKKNIKITPNTKFNETTMNFLIRVRSLDTHEKKEYKLTLINEKV